MGKFLSCQLCPPVRADMETTIVTPAEDKMVGWCHRLDGQTPGNGEGQGSLMYYSPWGCKESDMTEQLNNNKMKMRCTTVSGNFPYKVVIIAFMPSPSSFPPVSLEYRCDGWSSVLVHGDEAQPQGWQSRKSGHFPLSPRQLWSHLSTSGFLHEREIKIVLFKPLFFVNAVRIVSNPNSYF